MRRRGRQRFRAVSSKGETLPWRRSLEAAVRDAVYAVRGWGRMVGGVSINISCDMAMHFFDEVKSLGWTFQRWSRS